MGAKCCSHTPAANTYILLLLIYSHTDTCHSCIIRTHWYTSPAVQTTSPYNNESVIQIHLLPVHHIGILMPHVFFFKYTKMHSLLILSALNMLAHSLLKYISCYRIFLRAAHFTYHTLYLYVTQLNGYLFVFLVSHQHIYTDFPPFSVKESMLLPGTVNTI